MRFHDGNSICILGQVYTIKIVKTHSLKNYVTTDGSNLLILRKSELFSSDLLIEAYIKKHVKLYAAKRCKELSELYKFDYAEIRIKSTTSRWGSCSSKKNLNFSWILGLGPLEVFDYVIVHELCHTVFMNHKKEFWDLVKSVMKDYKKNRLWLKHNGHELMKYR